jgi:hypothetical protein
MAQEIDFCQEGPMKEADMLGWLNSKKKKLQPLKDMCIIASGYDPRIPEVQAFNIHADEGYPERYWASFYHTVEGKVSVEETDGIKYVNRDQFMTWLKEHDVWRKCNSVIFLLSAWKKYRGSSPFDDSHPLTMREVVKRAVDTVRAETNAPTISKAIDILLSDEKYHELREKIKVGSGDSSKKLDKDNLKVYYSTAISKDKKL